MATKQKYAQVSMAICFWCKQETNAILIGKRLKTTEAPKYAIHNYEPCEACQQNMELGVTLIEVDTQPLDPKQPPLSKQVQAYPTGRFIIVKPEAILRMIEEPLATQIVTAGRSLVDRDTFQTFFAKPQED